MYYKTPFANAIKNATEKLNKFDEIMIFNPKDYKGNMSSLFPNKQPIHLIEPILFLSNNV